MDRVDLSAAIIADAGETVMTLLREALPDLLSADLASLERHLQGLGRLLWGQVVEAIIGVRAQDEHAAPSCASCGQPMRRVEAARPRQLQGLVGDYTLRRAYYHCAPCGQGQAPLDAQLGLGRGALSPALLRVVCRAGVEEAFAAAADMVQEALGVWVSADSVERATERMGAVAEACVQEAVGRVKQGQAAWSAAEITAPPTNGVLAVEVDGVQVHRDDGWHEMKVVTVAPLGPALHHERASGRTHWAWGTASYGAGFEEAEDFWYRAYVEACRRGLGTPAVQTVVVLGDGAEWIWHRAAAFLGTGPHEVVEIVDIYHAYEYLWSVGHALFGAGTPEAVRWVEPLKDQLYTQGAAPVLAALEASQPPSAEAAEIVRVAHGYFTTQAARMDYPRFVARQFPIGSGAVESTCKSLVEARAKGAGMRWSRPGAQAVLSLRALQRSERWDAFWRTQPQRQHVHLCPRARPCRHPHPQPACTPPPSTVPVAARCAPPVPGPRSRPTPTARQRPLLLPRSA
ncbi:MAG: ISKra4 family transposase [Chloroflexi bacterium]|nr:ISKra4 family transposase [Chloroflexota bacterium]